MVGHPDDDARLQHTLDRRGNRCAGFLTHDREHCCQWLALGVTICPTGQRLGHGVEHGHPALRVGYDHAVADTVQGDKMALLFGACGQPQTRRAPYSAATGCAATARDPRRPSERSGRAAWQPTDLPACLPGGEGLHSIDFGDHIPLRIGDRSNIRHNGDAPVILPLDNAGGAHHCLNRRQTHIRQRDAQFGGLSAAVAQVIQEEYMLAVAPGSSRVLVLSLGIGHV